MEPTKAKMNDFKIVVLTVTLSLSLVLVFDSAESCNEAVCGSVVTKCMLTQSCECNLKNCSCCQQCFECLSHLFTECCSCFGLCPKPNNTEDALSKKSHVEDFEEPIPDLFQALMAEPDTLERWHTFTYPVDFDISSYKPKIEKEIKILSKNEQEVAPSKDIVTLNCTVAFMSQCMSWNKCRSSCQSTGASKYRWFHDGCCECIGHTCINYGINESQCTNCPVAKENHLEEQAALYFDDGNSIDNDVDDKAFQQAQAEAHRVPHSP